MDRLAADRMFVQVVRMGGFSAAAARAGVSPGQASKLVSRLESHLGLRLLTRTTRAISLTPEGEAYLASIAAILDQLDDLDDSLRDAAANPSGLLRLTAPLTFGTVQLMPALNDFARAHPAVTLQVDFTDDIVSLAQQGVDLAIRAGQPRDSTLVGRKLAVMRIQVVAAPAYLAARGTPQQPEDLRGHAIITDLNFAQPDDWQFQDGSRRVTLSLPGRLRFSNAEACVSAAIAGLGVTRVPDFIAAPAIRDGALTQLFAPMTPQQVPIMAITPPGRHMPARVRLLVDFLRDRWGPDHRWDD
ncbi:MAG: LysR family transcriptional regulator [Paracoccus sp. (in: a-proteobacteria)]|uniref:LysR family transcriptional regulator n=1 Tax=Paracoccus sp. TaxID=267 RepID=UPI003242F88A